MKPNLAIAKQALAGAVVFIVAFVWVFVCLSAGIQLAICAAGVATCSDTILPTFAITIVPFVVVALVECRRRERAASNDEDRV